MFSKLRSGPDTEAMARGGNNGRDNGQAGAAGFSILAADMVLRGDVHAAADLHIDGRIEGDIACAALFRASAAK